MPLLVKLILGIVLGIAIGLSTKAMGFLLPIQLLATFNGLFGSFLSFVVPLLILSFVSVGIADLGGGAGKLLGLSVGMAYVSTIVFTLLAMFASQLIVFPALLTPNAVFSDLIDNPKNFLVSGLFSIPMPPALDVMTALLLAFVLGVGLTKIGDMGKPLFQGLLAFQKIIEKLIAAILIPLLPIHIAGVFANMSYGGKAFEVMRMMMVVFGIILSYHAITLVIHFVVASIVQKKSPLKLFLTMFPAYVTALGTQSSAASIPVSKQQMKQAGVREDIANFTAPLFATIHMPGSAITISTIAFSLMYMSGAPFDYSVAINFVLMLGIAMVAAPGVPGGAVMAASAILISIMGFGETLLALTIAMHLAQDSFGTACNVTADGALSLEIDAIAGKMKE
ncbi:dicarboxylate/amino acid:cation symporter [Spirochaetales bacterium BR151]|uniref:Dicarboxylate/amino acid:cation symporter n=2 Tax=Entomospira culicis TaxID=2719989 RepID=A0A968GI04_9SPIO|nr:cation:dicarboxylase symporter family transporter [Entomospira culicis]NIZ18770.1 dicarboxylate/amino acid:cation symporter [Entomospira culicis]NIZ68985.1 dicarboxylate/amino acid:cation symporter [Entomospira culicis]